MKTGRTIDPFGERATLAYRRVLSALAADIEFLSNDPRLIRLAERAFADLPRHRWRDPAPRLVITMRLEERTRRARRKPPQPRFTSGAGNLFAVIDESNFACIDPAGRRAYLHVTTDMLAHEHEVRYELVEFAALTLATRVQELVPLHAACVALEGRGLLILGASGAGKSSFTLCSLLDGFELLAEDSVFVSPSEGRAVGVANFLHVRADAVRFVDGAIRDVIRQAPVIERRSGARKHQVDLRSTRARLAPRPVEIVGTLVLSTLAAAGDELLRPLGRRELIRQLRGTQEYAQQSPRWGEFERRLTEQGGYRLLRDGHPLHGVRAARSLVERGASRAVRR